MHNSLYESQEIIATFLMDLHARSTPSSMCPEWSLLFDHKLTCLNLFIGFSSHLFYLI